jgi:methylated-DNA-protein-cysteine methyltransferase-like protein
MTVEPERIERIVAVIRALGRGEVTTYGDVADVAGYPKHARLVGHILATTDERLPWWRVVNASGTLRAVDVVDQADRLRREGVDVVGGRVVRAPRGRFSRTACRATT